MPKWRAGNVGGWALLCWVLLLSLTAHAAPLAWVVEQGGNRLILMGSIHYGRPDFYPLPPSIQTEFDASQALAVELDIGAVSQVETLQLIMSLGMLAPDLPLQTAVGPALYRQLSQWCESNGIPCEAFERMQPWVIALQVMESALAKSSLKSDLGVERVLLAARGDMQLIELETLEQQLRLFAELDLPTQSALLAQTLADYGDSRAYMDVMADAWLAGDQPALEALLLEPLRGQPKVGAKLLDALLYSRNGPMAVAAERMLKQYRHGFFLVGVGHLVGPDSVVDLLRRRGLRVDRLQVAPSSVPAKTAAALN